jgi:hypothetical protein
VESGAAGLSCGAPEVVGDSSVLGFVDGFVDVSVTDECLRGEGVFVVLEETSLRWCRSSTWSRGVRRAAKRPAPIAVARIILTIEQRKKRQPEG